MPCYNVPVCSGITVCMDAYYNSDGLMTLQVLLLVLTPMYTLAATTHRGNKVNAIRKCGDWGGGFRGVKLGVSMVQ